MRITESRIRRIIMEEISKLSEGEITGKREGYEVEPEGYELGVQSDDEVIPDEIKEMDAAQVQAMHTDADDESTEPPAEDVVDLPESWERIAFGPRRW